MGVRDEELRRLEKYAEGLGVKVYYRPYIPFSLDAALWSIDGTQIVIFVTVDQSKTALILSLIHEIGHHLSFVYKNKMIPKKLDMALDRESNQLVPTKEQRKALLDWELLGMEYHLNVYKECDVKIPEYKLHVENEVQKYIYTYYYKHGKVPTHKMREDFHKKTVEKYKV